MTVPVTAPVGPAALRLQPMVRARLAGLGPAGEAWRADLPGLLARLCARWGARVVGRSLPGGSASLVVPVETATGPAALKVAVPGEDLGPEARVLAVASGSGYARLLGHAPEDQAVLVERLGPSLDRSPQPVEESLETLSRTLRLAWDAVPGDLVPAPARGADRASTRHARLTGLARSAGPRELEGWDGALLEALRCAERRAAAYDPRDCVVAHGDAHPGNLLRRPAVADPTDPGAWAFVDPDGVRAEPACDVGVALRDWSSHLLGPGSRARLEGWCARAAADTGTDEQAVWDWAYLERVATGLWVTSFGASAVGRPFLLSAVALRGARASRRG